MARVVVIGATGHVGGYLVPRLVRAGHDVVAVSRGEASPYREDPAWQQVERRRRRPRPQLEADDRFGAEIAALGGDIVIDLICFTLASARQLVEAVADEIDLLVHIGTVWTHGHSVAVPTVEEAVKKPFGDYGIAKAEVEAYLLRQARRHGLPVTIVHPGHIVGPGWVPLNPAGHFNPEVYATIARGEPLTLPNLGLETVHHVHADDVAALVMATIGQPAERRGELPRGLGAGPVSARLRRGDVSLVRPGAAAGLPPVRGVGRRSGIRTRRPRPGTTSRTARAARWPRPAACWTSGPHYSSLEAVQESVTWLIANGRLAV